MRTELVSPNPTAPPAHSLYVARSTRIPAGAEDVGAKPALATLAAVADRLGGRPVLIAADDVAALFVEDHLAELGDRFRLPAQPAGLAHRLSHKGDLQRLCVANAIPAPESRF
ncbi:MAG TPA: hypothetical protein VET90_02525, partial [Candidatus Binatus sp.]|nr:hypothetical protein [Candidatus Binatus sp.]